MPRGEGTGIVDAGGALWSAVCNGERLFFLRRQSPTPIPSLSVRFQILDVLPTSGLVHPLTNLGQIQRYSQPPKKLSESSPSIPASVHFHHGPGQRMGMNEGGAEGIQRARMRLPLRWRVGDELAAVNLDRRPGASRRRCAGSGLTGIGWLELVRTEAVNKLKLSLLIAHPPIRLKEPRAAEDFIVVKSSVSDTASQSRCTLGLQRAEAEDVEVELLYGHCLTNGLQALRHRKDKLSRSVADLNEELGERCQGPDSDGPDASLPGETRGVHNFRDDRAILNTFLSEQLRDENKQEASDLWIKR
ncbi:hypothetical protein B0H19DRAFT_1065831 [Mycena capillaripes]|nr:hypothetical protein B0H19DRAFT_1065831 [Mycena capillaripes]